VRIYQVVHQVTIAENQTVVTTATATDPDGDTLTYSLGGVDAQLFSINSNGEITFKSAPDFENPTDTGADNTYNITVTASDGSLTSSQAVVIAVTNATEDFDPSVDASFWQQIDFGTVNTDFTILLWQWYAASNHEEF
jgi:hypothetical protein